MQDFSAYRNPDNEIIFNLCPFKALSTPVILDTVTGKRVCEFIAGLVIISANYSFGCGVITSAPSGATLATFILADISQSRRVALPPFSVLTKR